MTDTTFPAPLVSSEPVRQEDQRKDAADVRACVAVARHTLRQAAEEAISLPDATVDAVISTERALDGGGLTAEQETRFWKAYAYIRANVATTTSLRRRYNGGFLVLLAFLMIVQAGFISATSLIDGIRTEWSIVRDYTLNQTDFCKSLTEPAAVVSAPATTEKPAHPAPAGKTNNCPTRTVMEPEYHTALVQLRSYDHLLEAYSFLLPGTNLDETEVARSNTAGTVREYKHYVHMGALVNIRHFMELFILPALYGALGACAFVLRKFSYDMRDGTLTSDSGIRYGLRISIGILSGLIIHWFIRPVEGGDPGSAATVGAAVQHLSRYALSFVAGYGSEIVFNILDRLVVALAPPRQNEGGQATAHAAPAKAAEAKPAVNATAEAR
ncbi:MAG TPA: hypothetical protein VD995_17830 [Azospirillum sp.]|nr:hypothetical protein [Azospirillum sp.]